MKKETLIKYSWEENIQLYTKKDKLGEFFSLITGLIIEWTKWEKKGVTTSIPGPVQEKLLDLATGFNWYHGFKPDKPQKTAFLQDLSDWSIRTASAFYESTMKELGADEETNLTTVLDKGKETKRPVFRCDLLTGNYHILITKLDGSLIEYEKRDINEDKTKILDYELMRKVRPDGKGKYKIPFEAGTYPFFPENIKQAYKDKKQIDTLFITEGAKKAFKGYTSGGLYVVGLSSISNYRDVNSSKGNIKLHKDIITLIRACKVKNIVILWDGDCRNISTKALALQQNIDQRPRNFFNYAKKICSLIKNEITEHKSIYFSTIKTDNIEGKPKGLDDLLLWAETQKESEVKRVVRDLLALEDDSKVFTRTFNITNNDALLYEYFCLNDPDRFYLKHIDVIEGREFLFSGDRYIYINATNRLKLLQPNFLNNIRWIGDYFYEILDMPIPSKDNEERTEKTLNMTLKSTLKDLHGKDFIRFMVDKHYKGFCNIPNHFNYQFEIESGGGLYYNKYFPFEWTPKKGDFKVIEGFIRHIFGEQYEMGLDYIQLLLLNPMQKLPVLCLYSPENATGKSKFGELLSIIFKNNVVFINNDDLKSEFGLDRFAPSLLAICDETLLERKKDVERIKMITTAEAPILCNPKGAAAYKLNTYVKLIFNSNNLRMIHATENDERFWIIRVPNPKEKDPDLMDKMREEIPAFIDFLKNRAMSTPKRGRMWFDPDLIKTDTLREVVRVNEHSDVQELRSKLEDYFIDFPDEPNLMLSTKDVIDELMPGKTRNWMDEIIGLRLGVKRYTNRKGKTVVKRSYFLKKVPQTEYLEDIPKHSYKDIKVSKPAQRVWVFNREDFLLDDVDYNSSDSDLTEEVINELNKNVA